MRASTIAVAVLVAVSTGIDTHTDDTDTSALDGASHSFSFFSNGILYKSDGFFTAHHIFIAFNLLSTIHSSIISLPFFPLTQFFTLDYYASNWDLAMEYRKRGLVPDPVAQIAVNASDPAFGDDHPNGTHWEREKRGWAVMIFYCSSHLQREVYVDRDGNGAFSGWKVGYWFGGVRKKKALES